MNSQDYVYINPSPLLLIESGFEEGKTGGYNLFKELGYGANLFIHIKEEKARINVISESYNLFMPFYDEFSDHLCDEGSVRTLVTDNYSNVMNRLCDQGVFEKDIKKDFVKCIEQ